MNPVDSMFAILFVADGPVTLEELSNVLGFPIGQVEQIFETLSNRLLQSGPLQAVMISGGVQLSTKPEFGPLIADYLRPKPQRLSRSLLETLAIVAYRQPTTLAEIESIRGVQSDYSVRSLVERGFLEEVGKKSIPGRPSLYGTTPSFLHQFKLNDLSQLPDLQAALPFSGDVVTKGA